MKRVVAVALAVLSVSAAQAASASTRTTVASEGVTNKEIDLGITYVDLKAIRDVVNLDHGDYEGSYNAVIKDLNKTGINGRKVVATFAPVNPIGTSPAQEACVKLTEDKKVFAVAGFFNNDAPLCYVEQHDTPVIGGNITGEYLARAKAPWFSPNAGDATASQLVDAFTKEGLFGKGKVGIVTAAQEKGLLDDVVIPALKRNKIKYDSAIIDTPPDDVTAAEQAAGVVAERFRTEGYKTVLAVGNAIQVFAKALEQSQYRPRLLATNRETYLGYVGDKSHVPDVVKGSVSGGPSVDFNDPDYVQCRALIEKALGIKIKDPTTVKGDQPNPGVSAFNACVNISMFRQIAQAAGKKLTVASFGKAGNMTLDLPGYGTVSYDPKTHAYSLPIRLTRYDPASDQAVEDKDLIKS